MLVQCCRTIGLMGLIAAATVQLSHAESSVFASNDSGGTITSGVPIATLTVPAGKYAVFAKINIDHDDTVTKWMTITCTLRADTSIDQDVVRLHGSDDQAAVDKITLPLQLVHTFAKDMGNNITLFCEFASWVSLVSFTFAKITAIRLDGRFCKKRSPASCL